jgi:hypothetical protein
MISDNVKELTKKVRERLLTPKEAAEFLGCSEQKLANDRWNSRGCPYYKDGRLVR